MKKIINCRLCGKKAKVSAKQYVVWQHNKIVMWKHDGPFGGFECVDGSGCKK
jgi:hypothetical protein